MNCIFIILNEPDLTSFTYKYSPVPARSRRSLRRDESADDSTKEDEKVDKEAPSGESRGRGRPRKSVGVESK